MRILIAEDEPKLLAILCDYFSSKGDHPVAAKNGLEALHLAEQGEFDGVLLDIMMPELDGFAVHGMGKHTAQRPLHSVVSEITNAIKFVACEAHARLCQIGREQFDAGVQLVTLNIIAAAVIIPQINTICAKVKKSLCDSIDFKRRLMLGNRPLLASFRQT